MLRGPVLVAVEPAADIVPVIEAAADLARALGCPLIALHVVPMAEAVDPDVLHNPQAHPAAAKRLREQEAAVAPTLRGLIEPARDAGVAVRLEVAHGDAAQAIVAVARSEGAGVIVLGTHGRRGLWRVALGSVAEAVLRHATVPVLTVRVGQTPLPDPFPTRPIALD